MAVRRGIIAIHCMEPTGLTEAHLIGERTPKRDGDTAIGNGPLTPLDDKPLPQVSRTDVPVRLGPGGIALGRTGCEGRFHVEQRHRPPPTTPGFGWSRVTFVSSTSATRLENNLI
jgi:hypothetical protein